LAESARSDALSETVGLALVGLLIGSVAVALVENSAEATTVAAGLMMAGVEVCIPTKMAGGFAIAFQTQADGAVGADAGH